MSEKFKRWQEKSLKQLTYTINLFLGFSIAILGFEFSLLFKNSFSPICFEKFAFSASIFALIASAILGSVCVVNRLIDFRITAQITRKKDKNNSDGIDDLRNKSNKLGNRTWAIFWGQIALFGLGTILLVTSLLFYFSSKIF
ncbi:hypothetical protein NC796_24310 [Aliifodinibius sp. S!AR15-10]|uniref:hypothetical protein n=1 Tax=Aliifodinibius sp. S!AR15-10 TaxID=2950437 RepID=UPI002855738F|nr:hypothetical protein [Aliifodinibius sp. S!AR15-10]MDR8394294.1 hypothetical protein [Aliifodinibius sp. S!AR15-10]